MVTVAGKLEITIKITEFPAAQPGPNGSMTFEIDCDEIMVSVTVRPKVWKKLEDAQAKFPMWVAAVSGKMGDPTAAGFVLLEPSIQVFEKKPKEPTAA